MPMDCHWFWTLKCLGHLIIILAVPCTCHIHEDHGADPHDHHHHIQHNQNYAEPNLSIVSPLYSNASNAAGNQSSIDSNFVLHQIFEKYGHDGVITLKNFELYLKSLGLHGGYHITDNFSGHHMVEKATPAKLQSPRSDLNHSTPATMHSQDFDIAEASILVNSQPEKCRSPTEILQSSNIDPSNKTIISLNDFMPLCPVILYEIGLRQCVTSDEDHHSEHHQHDEQVKKLHEKHVFLYSTLAVLVISVSGMMCVTIVPMIQKYFYQHFLHFFIALAIGSLTGDALLHLLPHAMSEIAMIEQSDFSSSDHQHHNHRRHGHDHRTIWIGLTCLGGICVCYVMERFINLLTQWRHKGLPNITVEVEINQTNGHDKVFASKQNSISLDYDKVESYILQSINKVPSGNDEDVNLKLMDSCPTSMAPDAALDLTTTTTQLNVPDEQQNRRTSNGAINPRRLSGLVKTDHTIKHHGHAHSHSHHKEVPATASALAWMVIAGDGLHNFSDGMAIGAAFASSLVVGLSTSIAVFCHELPHELGDFALLLKAGMKIRQALLYNTLSSILCFFGMLLGLFIGNISTANSWVFAGIAGMFIYISLVDMVPELNSENIADDFGGFTKFSIQALGLITGVAIMGVIAIYESDLQSMFDS